MSFKTTSTIALYWAISWRSNWLYQQQAESIAAQGNALAEAVKKQEENTP